MTESLVLQVAFVIICAFCAGFLYRKSSKDIFGTIIFAVLGSFVGVFLVFFAEGFVY